MSSLSGGLHEGTGPAPPAEETPEAPAAALILSLPTLAQAAFGVIVVAFAGIMAAALVGDAPVLMWPIVLSLVVFPARWVMGRPERERREHEDAATTQTMRDDGRLARIEAYAAGLAASAYGRRLSGVIILRQPIAAHVIGSWRRDYLALGHKTAARIAQELDKPVPAEWVRALLLHEMAHVAARDPQRVGLAAELLRGAFTILPWWMLFLAFWIGMALQGLAAALAFDFAAVPGMPAELAEAANGLIALDPALAAQMRQRAAETNYTSLVIFVVLSLWPIALTSGILYLFFWRWMLRLQEYYADLNAARRGASAAALNAPHGWMLPLGRPESLGWRIVGGLRDRLRALWPGPVDRLSRWFSTHPTLAERGALLAAPERLFDDWPRVAWSTAVLSVGLDAIFSSPLFLYHGLGVHLYTLTALVLLSTWLLPQLALGRPVARPLARVLLLLVVVRAVWLGLNMALLLVQALFFPAVALEVLNSLIIAGSRYVGPLKGLPVTDPLMALGSMVGAVGLEVLELGGLALALAAYVAAQRRAPGASGRRHWPLVALIAVGVYALMLGVLRVVGN